MLRRRGEDGRKGMPPVLRFKAEPPAHDLLFVLIAKAQKVLQKLSDVQEIFHKRQMSLMKLVGQDRLLAQCNPWPPILSPPQKWVSPKISQPPPPWVSYFVAEVLWLYVSSMLMRI